MYNIVQDGKDSNWGGQLSCFCVVIAGCSAALSTCITSMIVEIHCPRLSQNPWYFTQVEVERKECPRSCGFLSNNAKAIAGPQLYPTLHQSYFLFHLNLNKAFSAIQLYNHRDSGHPTSSIYDMSGFPTTVSESTCTADLESMREFPLSTPHTMGGFPSCGRSDQTCFIHACCSLYRRKGGLALVGHVDELYTVGLSSFAVKNRWKRRWPVLVRLKKPTPKNYILILAAPLPASLSPGSVLLEVAGAWVWR